MKRPTFRFNLNTLFSHPYAFGVYFYCHYMPERSGARCLFLTLAKQKTNKSDWLCHRVSFSSHTSILMHAYRYVPSRIHIAHSTLTSLAYLVTTVRKYFLVNVMLIFSKTNSDFWRQMIWVTTRLKYFSFDSLTCWRMFTEITLEFSPMRVKSISGGIFKCKFIFYRNTWTWFWRTRASGNFKARCEIHFHLNATS